MGLFKHFLAEMSVNTQISFSNENIIQGFENFIKDLENTKKELRIKYPDFDTQIYKGRIFDPKNKEELEYLGFSEEESNINNTSDFYSLEIEYPTGEEMYPYLEMNQDNMGIRIVLSIHKPNNLKTNIVYKAKGLDEKWHVYLPQKTQRHSISATASIFVDKISEIINDYKKNQGIIQGTQKHISRFESYGNYYTVEKLYQYMTRHIDIDKLKEIIHEIKREKRGSK